MRRVAVVFVIISLLSAVMRIVTPERIVAAAVNVIKAPQRFQRAVSRACLLLTKRLRPLLPHAS